MNLATVNSQEIHSDVVAYLSQANDDQGLAVFIQDSVNHKYPLLAKQDKELLAKNVLNDVKGYGFLQELLDDKSINEIMINSSTCAYIDKQGAFSRINIDVTSEQLIGLIQKIASEVGSQCDVSHPILDAWLSDGSRVHAVLPPVAADGPYMTIRRFVTKSYELSKFTRDENQERIIETLIEKRKNIIIAGGTSTGKTTLLNCLINRIPKGERILSIEETAELSCSHPHLVRLIARSANSEGAGNITLGDLVKASLRMRPDRVVVGEIRSGEAFDLIQALNTGHDGSMCTIHANGPSEVVHRLGSLALFAHPGLDYRALTTQIAYGIDVVIFVTRVNGLKRTIKSICELVRDGEDIVLTDLETKERYYV